MAVVVRFPKPRDLQVERLRARAHRSAVKDSAHNRTRKKWREWFINATWIAIFLAILLGLEGLGINIPAFVRWPLVGLIFSAGAIALIVFRRCPTLHPEIQRAYEDSNVPGLRLGFYELVVLAGIWHKLGQFYPLTYESIRFVLPERNAGNLMERIVRVEMIAGPIGQKDELIQASCLLHPMTCVPMILNYEINSTRTEEVFTKAEQSHLRRAVNNYLNKYR